MSTLITPSAPGPEQQDAPLSEEERKLLTRLFSDPTYFPIEFRTWIRSYIESSDIRLPSSAIVGGNAPKVNLPAGCIIPFAGGSIPSNCLPCDGRSLVRIDYDLLFEALGTYWGSVDAGHFNIPDLRDRALYGAGSVIGLAATDGRASGSRGGPRHHHYFGQTSDPAGAHGHTVSGSTGGVAAHQHIHSTMWPQLGNGSTMANPGTGTGRYVTSIPNNELPAAGDHSHSFSGGSSTQGDHSHFVDGDTTGGYDQDQPSYAGVNYIIATGKNV